MRRSPSCLPAMATRFQDHDAVMDSALDFHVVILSHLAGGIKTCPLVVEAEP